MKAGELRQLTHKELVDALSEAKEEFFNLRFQLATNQLDNTARLRSVRRSIARINGVIREQEIAAWRAQQAEAETAAAGTDSA